MLAAPVLDPSGHPIGVVVGALDEAVLPDHPRPGTADRLGGRGGRRRAPSRLFDRARRVDGSALLAKGALSTTISNHAVTQAEAGKSGAAQYRSGGHDVLAGYDGVDELGWTILVQERASTVLAPVREGREPQHRAGLIGAALAIGFSIVFARRATTITALGKAAEAVAAGTSRAMSNPTAPTRYGDSESPSTGWSRVSGRLYDRSGRRVRR